MIVTDKLPEVDCQLCKKHITPPDRKTIIRRKLASLLEYKIRKKNTVASINFDGTTTIEDLRSETIRALRELGTPTTIVYLAEKWPNGD